jgi:hypothetical protein
MPHPGFRRGACRCQQSGMRRICSTYHQRRRPRAGHLDGLALRDSQLGRPLTEDELKVVRGPRDRIRGGQHGFVRLCAEQDDLGMPIAAATSSVNPGRRSPSPGSSSQARRRSALVVPQPGRDKLPRLDPPRQGSHPQAGMGDGADADGACSSRRDAAAPRAARCRASAARHPSLAICALISSAAGIVTPLAGPARLNAPLILLPRAGAGQTGPTAPARGCSQVLAACSAR